MENFSKSILNYFATYNETRFNFNKKISYAWSNDELTLDLNIFEEFINKFFTQLSSGKGLDLKISQGEYKILLEEERFKKQFLDYIQGSLKKELLEAYSEENSEEKEHLLRNINLDTRKEIFSILNNLQQEKIKDIKKETRTEQIPISSLNIRGIEQKIYDYINILAKDVDSAEQLLKELKDFISKEKFELILFDLYSLILSYQRYVGTNNIYLFLHDMKKEERTFPLILLELSLEHDASSSKASFRIKNAQDFVMLNIPAVNSFSFDRVLTLPRASSFKTFDSDARSMEMYLDSYYKVNHSFILGLGFDKLVGDDLPEITPRLGLQILKEEKKSVLDYSEIIAKFDGSAGNRFTDMINDYVEGNVVDTTDTVQKEYKKNYPPRSSKALIHSLPISLNESQKKIVTAVNNPKNNIIVVDGPPGTGKSYTITALIYNAARKGKGVLITSHKKQALDVIEDQLTEQFKRLHPRAKPSIVRLTSDKEKTLNSIQNSLSNPAINHANQREANVNIEALEKDIKAHREKVKQNVDALWEDLEERTSIEKKIARYYFLCDKLKLPELDTKVSTLGNLEQDPLSKFSDLIAGSELDLSLENIKGMLSLDKNWKEVLERCEFLYENPNAGEYEKADIEEKEISDFLDSIIEIEEIVNEEYVLENIDIGEKEDFPSKPENYIKGEQFVVLEKSKELLIKLRESKSIINKLFKAKEIEKLENELKDQSSRIYELYLSLRIEDLLERLTLSLEYLQNISTTYPYLNISSFSVEPKFSSLQKLSKVKEEIFSLKNKTILDLIVSALSIKIEELTFKQLMEESREIKSSLRIDNIKEELNEIAVKLNSSLDDLEGFYGKLSAFIDLISKLNKEETDKMFRILEDFKLWFEKLGVDYDDLSTLKQISSDIGLISELIDLHVALSAYEKAEKPSREDVEQYNFYLQKKLEYENDKRFSDLANYAGDVNRILNAVTSGKRISKEESSVLLGHLTCIIAPPNLISKTFPMEENIFDTLIIDEASQVSIADSISLILRSKQTVVFGDELQYGAVGAVNVSKEYSSQYFKDILDNYSKDKKDFIAEDVKQKIIDDISKVDSEDEMESSQSYVISPATKEWLKTFSVRTSTLSFCKAIKNYSDSLNIHFRSYPEIIGYSNEFFYKESQIPLIVNRIRTKPIQDVLRFEKIETQGMAGQNVNLDEIEFVKNELQNLYDSGTKLTIGVICSFREQTARMEEELRKHLNGYHDLLAKNKLSIWFVGDVQGEERDIVYYSFVQDKKLRNADLKTIYPVVGGTADNIRKLKKQRLNVGFSRAKEQMVFVHSMPIEEYSDTVLGEALKFYKETLDTAVDNYIEDESIFDSPAEKDLYMLIQNTDFYKENKQNLRIIAQFPIGKYIAEEYHRYMPDYRVDFLLSLSHDGEEKSLILEYDGFEYHFKDTDNTNRHNFSNQYLEYDIQRQLELEGYGYKFLRINKFNILPSRDGETKVDVLNKLLKESFN
jgi:archaellum biogenesis ATPase FlaH/very-short-patch-repair endonuclease